MVRPRDTSEAAFERQLEAYRAMTPGERLAIGAKMSAEVRALAEAGIRERHPAFTDSQVADALAQIVLGPEFATQFDRSRLAKMG